MNCDVVFLVHSLQLILVLIVGNAMAAARQSFAEVVDRPTLPLNSVSEQVTDWFTTACHGAGLSPPPPPLKLKLGVTENSDAPESYAAVCCERCLEITVGRLLAASRGVNGRARRARRGDERTRKISHALVGQRVGQRRRGCLCRRWQRGRRDTHSHR